MILNNLSFALKSIRQNGVFSLINIAGLTVGICSALFIFIYVNFELSYDRFHERYQDIYRVLSFDDTQSVTTSNMTGITVSALGPAMEATILEVEEVVRVSANYSGYVTFNEKNYYADSLAYTEDVFFEVFSFTLLQSQSGPLLDRPHAAVLTQAFANKMFGSEAPLGKVITYDDQDFEVVAVMQDLPADSHMQFDLLASLHYLSPNEEGLDELQRELDSWDSLDMVTYARLAPNADEEEVEQKLAALMAERSANKTRGATLQPLAEAHLGLGDILFDFQVNPGDMREVAILASVAVFILLIAGFNFMNLASARASLRAKEVGVRKTMGATRPQLIRQFLLEAMLMVVIAAVLALAMLELLQPAVSLSLPGGGVGYLLQHRQLLLVSSFVLVFVGLVAGAYPAFMLSAVSPSAVLKGRFASATGGLLFRRILVVLQFALSIAIIIGTAVVYRQLDFMKNRDPGFEHEGIVNLDINEPALQANYAALKNRLLQLPRVHSVAGASDMPGSVIPRAGITPLGGGRDEAITVSGILADDQFIDTLSMNLIAGREFGMQDIRETPDTLILNESAVEALGLEDPIGKTVQWGNANTVVGVVQDFHFYNMHRRIEPLILLPLQSDPRVIAIAIDSNAAAEAIAAIAGVWQEINPNYPFSYSFFSDEYNKMFSDDERFAAMVSQFSVVAIIIACLGLYGLSAFSADQKTKEIGVRKVMGSSVWQIVLLLTNDFSRLVLVSNLIAWPLAYFAMERWLETFAYRIDLTPLIFIGSGLIALCIAWVTVGGTAAKAASAKPVLALRYE